MPAIFMALATRSKSSRRNLPSSSGLVLASDGVHVSHRTGAARRTAGAEPANGGRPERKKTRRTCALKRTALACTPQCAVAASTQGTRTPVPLHHARGHRQQAAQARWRGATQERLARRRGWAGHAIVPTRFGGVGAWRVRSNSAVFLVNRDSGCEDAVVFSEIGEDEYFDHRGADVHALRNTSKQMLAIDRVFHRREVL